MKDKNISAVSSPKSNIKTWATRVSPWVSRPFFTFSILLVEIIIFKFVADIALFASQKEVAQHNTARYNNGIKPRDLLENTHTIPSSACD